MGWTRVIARLFNLIFISVLLQPAVSAQELSGRVAGIPSIPTASTMSADTNAALQSATDEMSGKGTRGPYYLAWKPISNMTEHIVVDGSYKQRGIDYDIDYSSSMIAFTSPVSVSSTIRVEYSYPAGASKNSSPLNVPLSLNLLKKDNSELQFLGLYKQGDPNKKSADTLAYGLSGGMKTGLGNLNSMLMFSPDTPGSNSDGSFDDKSAIKLGSTTKTDNFQLTTSYLHVGEQFVAAKDYQMKSGTESMDYSAIFNAGKAIKLSSSFRKDESLSGDKKGYENSLASYAIAFSPDGAPTLSLSRVEDSKVNPNSGEVKTTTDLITAEHKLGNSVSASASHKDVTTEASGNENRVTTDQLTVSAKPTDNLAITSNLTQKDSSSIGKETGMGVDINASPIKMLSVKAAVNRLDSEKTGKANTEAFRLTANPRDKLSIDMNLFHGDTDTTGDELSHAFRIVSDQLKDVHVEAKMTGKNVDSPNDEQTKMFNLATTAIRNTTVSLDWRDLDSEARGFETYTGIRLETTPSNRIKISGIVGQRKTASVKEFTREAKLDITPLKNTRITGGLKELESNGEIVTRVTELSAHTKPISLIEMSGAIKSRERQDQKRLDSLALSLTLDAGRLAKITGSCHQDSH